MIGASGNGWIARQINRRLTTKYPPEFFEAWHLHNTIEVGTFENFLPALYEQRDRGTLAYARDMDMAPPTPDPQTGHDRTLFDARCEGFRTAPDPYAFQAPDAPSFL